MAGRTAAGPGSAQVQDREARDLGAPVGTPRLPDVGRGGARRGHTPSPNSAPTVPRLVEAAAVCGALSRSPCSVSIGASVVAAVSATQTRRSSSLFYSFCPGLRRFPLLCLPAGVCVSWCCVPGLLGPSYLPYPTPGTPLSIPGLGCLVLSLLRFCVFLS